MTNSQPRPASFVAAVIALILSGCQEAHPRFHADSDPQRLSDWALFSVTDGMLVPNPDSVVFAPASPLFSDYAQKLRTVWVPPGSRIEEADGELRYPVGTILSKTFYYPTDASGTVLAQAPVDAERLPLADNRVLETRLLVRRDSGWDALPYVWNTDISEAFLRVAGASAGLEIRPESTTVSARFTYFVPNENQCAGCHKTEHPDGELRPLGAIASQLGGQARLLQEKGWLAAPLTVPPDPSYLDESLYIGARALAYLDTNCGHCHNPEGPADTSALVLDGSHASLTAMGVCKPPVAAGGGAGNLRYSIVPGAPDESILLYRMRSTEADEMMPELGRSLVHAEGVDLISEWISGLRGSCP